MIAALRDIQLHGVSIANTLPSPRGRVMLRLYPTTSVSGTSAVVYAPTLGTNWTTWSETGLTWANQPAGTGLPAATPIATLSNTVAGRWIEVDVTQAVTQTIAWADTLTTTVQDVSLDLLLAGGAGTFASKEDPAFKPMLVFISSVLPNRNAWTLTVFAKNFNDTGALKISRITLHDDDGYGAIGTLQCGSSASCAGSFDYTPGAANKAVIAVAELSDGRYIVSAPTFF